MLRDPSERHEDGNEKDDSKDAEANCPCCAVALASPLPLDLQAGFLQTKSLSTDLCAIHSTAHPHFCIGSVAHAQQRHSVYFPTLRASRHVPVTKSFQKRLYIRDIPKLHGDASPRLLRSRRAVRLPELPQWELRSSSRRPKCDPLLAGLTPAEGCRSPNCVATMGEG